MKKLFLTLAIALGTVTVSNAIEADQMWVGGTAGFWSSKVTGMDNQLSFKVMPEFGIVLSENIGIGISLGGSHTHSGFKFDGSIAEDEDTKAQNTYIVNPFLRYTFLKGDLGSLFFDGGLAYQHIKEVSGGRKANGLEVGLRPGVAINVSDKIALIGKFGFLGYQYTKQDAYYVEGGSIAKKSPKSNSFGFDFDMSNIQIGMNLKF